MVDAAERNVSKVQGVAFREETLSDAIRRLCGALERRAEFERLLSGLFDGVQKQASRSRAGNFVMVRFVTTATIGAPIGFPRGSS